MFGGLFFVATHLFLRSRERALLLRACYDAAGQNDVSEIRGDYVEAPEIVLAALNVPQCVAYVRAVRSSAVDHDLAAVRVALAVKALQHLQH